MDVSNFWRSFFVKWPVSLPQKGVAVTNYGEQVLFVAFLVSEQAVLLDRLAPDSVGGRKLILPYQNIETIKIVDPVSSDLFQAAGFLPIAGQATGSKSAASE